MQMPVFCGPPFEADPEHAGKLIQLLEQAGLPIQIAFATRHSTAPLRLRRLCGKRFGTPRGCRLRVAGPEPIAMAEWLDWCAVLFGSAPTHATAAGIEKCSSVFLEFTNQRFADLQFESAEAFAADGEVI